MVRSRNETLPAKLQFLLGVRTQIAPLFSQQSPYSLLRASIFSFARAFARLLLEQTAIVWILSDATPSLTRTVNTTCVILRSAKVEIERLRLNLKCLVESV